MYEECIKHIKDHLHISFDKDLIIDPNAGNQEFMNGIETLAKMTLFYNKSPIHENVLPLDFLQIEFNRYDKTFLSGLWYDDVHLISHPPPDQIELFIKAACQFAESISFIMPKPAQYSFPSNYQRIFSTSLSTDTIFQIWIKADA
jgi:hypothetical protein